MTENETTLDRLLKIRTTGRDDSHSDQYKYPYEPTPYAVLGRLANSGEITKSNTLLDYGCGKGRVDFYLSYQTRCHAIGVEYDLRLFTRAEENRRRALSGKRVKLELGDASEYDVPSDVDRCFFFNPFSVEILQSVMARILESYYEIPRQIRLYFYYPSDEYIAYLMRMDEVEFVDEIDCQDLYENPDARETIMIFSLGQDLL